MSIKTRHTHKIETTEEVIREAIPDGLGLLTDECSAVIASVQKSFQGFIRLADAYFDSLRADIGMWRQRVRTGEVEFCQAEEAEFKEAMRALIELADLLYDRSETYLRQSIVLHRPTIIGMLRERRRDAQKVLDAWQSPEWEVVGARRVKWSEEQTKHLRARLASVE